MKAEHCGTEENVDSVRAKPFLRWVGGKQNLVRRLIPFLPERQVPVDYWEPFLGAGSLFFALSPAKSHLSDLNPHLIECYKQVRDHPDKIADLLESHAANSSSDHYYRERAAYNLHLDDPVVQAARFIYLNRTCFNGVFRVNRSNLFNVPYGRKEPPLIPAKWELAAVSQSLKSAELEARDFREVLRLPSSGDFLYIDPPYPAVNGCSSFNRYTAGSSRVPTRRISPI